ncbi:MAG: hypothetical protein JSU79_03475 [Dehalococcoidales bacterium]|nr:MAG: hypothetical protein JSU79_03475 [Dehalococcoidales bacterium]
MVRYILEVRTNCSDPQKEAEYNDWYNTIHLPDVLETEGVVRATRYENTDPAEGDAKFVAIYEIETDDIDTFMVVLSENVQKKREAGRMNDLLVRTHRGLYKQTYTLSADKDQQ